MNHITYTQLYNAAWHPPFQRGSKCSNAHVCIDWCFLSRCISAAALCIVHVKAVVGWCFCSNLVKLPRIGLHLSFSCFFRHEFDSEQIPDLTKDVYIQDIHCVGSLCKLYFRELPNPLLTYQLYEKFSVSKYITVTATIYIYSLSTIPHPMWVAFLPVRTKKTLLSHSPMNASRWTWHTLSLQMQPTNLLQICFSSQIQMSQVNVCWLPWLQWEPVWL